ncbi:MAG TPA: dihydrofolate reductase family protein [Solirubrobacteraceae bacterium]|nr:dihydrofolate reductase family protein [Solirubrobacteraceae bacterium]
MASASYDSDVNAFLRPLGATGPITIAMMVSSVDGRATVDGRVGDLTGAPDQQVLLGTREVAAAVVVGGRTVRAEGYAGLLGNEAQARRQACGLPPEPELVVFTRASPSLPELWQQIRERHPDGLIVCEGGPTLLGMIVEHRLLDQLVLCFSPQIVADDGEKRLLEQHTGSLDVGLQLLALTSADGFLFLRYGLD